MNTDMQVCFAGLVRPSKSAKFILNATSKMVYNLFVMLLLRYRLFNGCKFFHIWPIFVHSYISENEKVDNVNYTVNQVRILLQLSALTLSSPVVSND